VWHALDIFIKLYNIFIRIKSLLELKTKYSLNFLLLNKVRYISQKFSSDLDPNFITGFTDAEGSFMIFVSKSSENRIGWSVGARFEISLHIRDEDLLNRIRTYFNGAGNITKFGEKKITFRVNDLEQITNIIIPHFQNYPLITKKRVDFKLFSNVVKLLSNKEHLTIDGLDKIVAIRASMNLGLSESLKASFPLIMPVPKPDFNLNKNFHPQWIAGFTSGEGYFGVKILSSSTIKSGKQVKLIFQLTQHSRDEILMKNLVDYFGCGKYYTSRKRGDFQVIKLSEIIEIIIPFFQNNCIKGEKFKDFKDWCIVANLMKNKKHLSEEGLKYIQDIVKSMNKGRY